MEAEADGGESRLADRARHHGPRHNREVSSDVQGRPAYENDPNLGTDPQPKHLKNKYTGTADAGGVHINSGIPNHAFFLVAMELGGRAWEKAGHIWYRTLLALNQTSGFDDMVEMSTQNAVDVVRIGQHRG